MGITRIVWDRVAFRDDIKTMPAPCVRIEEKIYVKGGGSVIELLF